MAIFIGHQQIEVDLILIDGLESQNAAEKFPLIKYEMVLFKERNDPFFHKCFEGLH